MHGSSRSGSGPAGPGTAAADQWQTSYSVPLREEPSSSADRLAQIPRGTVLETGERRGSWAQTEYDGLTGWVNTSFGVPT
nr:SH3 domain-containing protein [Nesterenkonia ebinurensis]